jgi:hypothetical protein
MTKTLVCGSWVSVLGGSVDVAVLEIRTVGMSVIDRFVRVLVAVPEP